MIRAFILASALAFSGFALSSCATFTPTPQTQATALQSGSYRLDKDHAALTLRISHFGISHYTGRFNDISAELSFDETNPEKAKMLFTVKTASLDVNNTEFEKTLSGPSWLDAANFPKAIFILDTVSVMGKNKGTTKGTLTLKGISQPVVFDVEFTGGLKNPLTRKYTIGFKAKGVIKRSDFGITKYLSIAGDKFDFDTVHLEFDGEFQKLN